MNQVAFIGRIVRDCELQSIQENRHVINNVLAIDRYNGNQESDFIPFVAWGKTAELIHAYCKKGDLIGLNGRMQSRSYIPKDGERKVYVVELVADQVRFLSNKRTEEK